MSAPAWIEGAVLAPLTTWRIGGPCRGLAEPATPAELSATRQAAERLHLPVFLLGGGSNILFADEGYPGVVVRYGGRERELTVHGDEAVLRVGARAALAATARESARAGWAGLEWAEGIPGTIGGAAVGNAGAYGGEIASAIIDLELVHPDGGAEIRSAAAMGYGYRASNLKGRDPSGPAVVALRIRLRRDDPTRLESEMRRIAAERRAKTPIGASCGSVFRNPSGRSAGRLIDEAGCKGMRCGRAVVSSLHANYIINEGGASARDVLELIEAIRARVRAASGIELDLEIQPVGFRAGA